PLQMMMTVQLLQNELMQILSASRSNLGTSKVAVTLPKTIPIPVAGEVVEVNKPVVPVQEKETHAPRNGSPKKSESANLLFDPFVEIPTLSHQQQQREINDAAAQDSESLNDRLKQD